MKKNLFIKIFTVTTIAFINFSEKAFANTTESNMVNVIANIQFSGAVNRPGIYRFPKGTRLVDALYKAGGLKKDAVVTDLNLTTPITDGTRIYIASQKEKESLINLEKKTNITSKNESNKALSKKENNEKTIKKNNGLVNLNTATEEEINSLPGIGNKLAKDIIRYRNKQGKFRDVGELNNIHGIGEKKLAKIKKRVIL